MSYLIDTNVISEIRKGQRSHPSVAEWFQRVEDEDLFLSSLVVGEIRKGIEKAKVRDPDKAERLENWLSDLLVAFEGFILPVDQDVAEAWGRMSSGRSLPIIDTLLAATAKVHDLTLVTRNIDDVKGTGAQIFNPFEARTS